MAKIGLSSQMISGYFAQGEQYFSESKDTFLQVREMHPNHAANAAIKLMDSAYCWSGDAGAEIDGPRGGRNWMIRQPLFLALVMRANLWL